MHIKIYNVTGCFIFNGFNSLFYCISHSEYLLDLIKDKYECKVKSMGILGARRERNECTTIHTVCDCRPFGISRERNKDIFATNGGRMDNNSHGAAYLHCDTCPTDTCLKTYIIHSSLALQRTSN
jgi:hypothetical protein